MTAQQLFESLQARWRKAHDKQNAFAFDLRCKYGETWSAPAGKRARLEKLQEIESQASGAIFTWLDQNSPRGWRSGVPAYWICDSLTYADAITTGQLAIIPPCGYGSYPRDSLRFAQAVA